MNFRLPLKKLLPVLGVLAVMCAQVFGIGRGFICDCSGAQIVTQSDHCHGPHGAPCVENAPPIHTGESCPDGGDARSHSAVEQDFQSAAARVADVVLTAPLLHVLLILDDAAWEKAPPVSAVEYLADTRGSPPPGVAVSRTVVLLI